MFARWVRVNEARLASRVHLIQSRVGHACPGWQLLAVGRIRRVENAGGFDPRSRVCRDG